MQQFEDGEREREVGASGIYIDKGNLLTGESSWQASASLKKIFKTSERDRLRWGRRGMRKQADMKKKSEGGKKLRHSQRRGEISISSSL